MLKSVENKKVAIKLLKNVIGIYGGLKISNSRDVLTTIAEEKHRQKINDQDLNIGDLLGERALGAHWNIENDYLGFCINLKDKTFTRRGMFSTISSVYDPLGVAAPFVLEGRKILQKLSQLKVSWHEEISDNMKKDWVCWRNKLPKLEYIKGSRCYKPDNFGNVMKAEVHHFPDASKKGSGSCSNADILGSSTNLELPIALF